MTPDLPARAFALFDEAVELPPAERAAFLDRACGGDAELRIEVEAMLHADTAPHALLDETPASLLDALPDAATATVEGQRVGPYRILHELGRGGMGTVYLAVRDDVGKQVALKLVRGALAAPESLARFLSERRILARLEHPNIARLLDAGLVEDGTPWFAMELVEGEPITAYADRHRLPIPARLRLFTQLCDAVAYAHRNLVVHRDIKPSNILVDESGRAKLLDFGIAKLLGEETQEEGLTATGMRLMTPEYAAPEQVRGEAVTTATDVFALGAVLYELLTGHRPQRVRGASLDEVARAVLHTDPLRPSAAVTRTEEVPRRDGVVERVTPAAVARARASEPARLRRTLSGDLDALVMRALAKEPARRYASAEALFADLRAQERGLPISAQRDTVGYRTSKFAGRHPAAIAASTGFAALIIGFTSFYTVRVTSERLRAEAAATRATQVAEFLKEMLRSADPTDAGGRQITAVEMLDGGFARIRIELTDQPLVQAELLELMSELYVELGRYDEAVEAARSGLELRRRLGGSAEEGTSSLARRLAAALDYLDREPEALRVLSEAIALERTRPGADGLVLAELLAGQASAAMDLGDFELSRRSFEEALRLRRRLSGETDPATLSTKNNYGHVLLETGDYAAAERLYREVFALRLELHGKLQTQTLTTMRNLGKALREQAKWDEAEQLEREALDISRRVYPSGHPRIAWALHGLGLVLLARGDHDAAGPMLEEALAAYRAAPHREQLRIARAQTALGRVRSAQGLHDEADLLLRDALAMYTRLDRPEHPDVGEVLGAVAENLARRGDLDAAEQHFRRAAAIQRERLGNDHPRLALTLHRLGTLLSTRDPTAAEAHLQETLAIQERRLPPEHADRLATLQSLALVRHAASR